MKVLISEKLYHVFVSSHKSPNYALNFLLSSIDLDVCSDCLRLVEEFKLFGDHIQVEIDERNVKAIQNMFGSVENVLIERLLWVSVLFPEI